MRISIFCLLAILALPARAQTSTFNYMESLVYPYPVQYADLSDGKRLAYIDQGKGDYTVVMIHGLGSYLPVYQKMVEILKTEVRCIALDLPNYGKSSRGDYAFDMPFFAETIAEFIRALGLQNVILAGHSMGGQIAMTLELRHPGIAKALVLLAPAGFETFSAENRAWFAMFMQPHLVKATPVPQIEANFNVNFHDNKLPEDARFMLEDRLKMRDDTTEYDYYCHMIPKCVMGMLDGPVYDQLPTLTLPVLVLYGEQDLLIPNRLLHPDTSTRQVAEHAQQRLPNSQLHLLPSCGHFVPWECAETVCAEILPFIHRLQR